jgi:hypothetical protein
MGIGAAAAFLASSPPRLRRRLRGPAPNAKVAIRTSRSGALAPGSRPGGAAVECSGRAGLLLRARGGHRGGGRRPAIMWRRSRRAAGHQPPSRVRGEPEPLADVVRPVRDDAPASGHALQPRLGPSASRSGYAASRAPVGRHRSVAKPVSSRGRGGAANGHVLARCAPPPSSYSGLSWWAAGSWCDGAAIVWPTASARPYPSTSPSPIMTPG